MTSPQPLLEIADLCVAYAKVEALHKVSLTLNVGEIVTVIGPNGAGKTTLLSAIMGTLASHEGEVMFARETSLIELDVEDRVAMGIILVPEKRELFAEMSVEDNLRMGAFMRYRMGFRDQTETMEQVFTTFPRLRERRLQAAGTLSGGERQMLAMGRALMAKPRLLMLDEPSLGLAPLIVKEIFNIVSGLRKTGVGILLVEQNARAALKLADRGYVLETGEVALSGPSPELASNPRIIDSYLGLGTQHP